MTARLQTRRPELTDRQLEVARLIRDDLTNGEIAEALGISLSGAKHHVQELLRRLDLETREEIGDWYEEQHPTGLRRLRGLVALPLAGLALGIAGVAATGTVVVVLLAAGIVGSGGSPGESIVFPAKGLSGNPDLFAVNADGSGLRNLTQEPGVDLHPSYSPDGSRIVFESSRSPNRNIQVFVMDADGGGLEQLTFDEDGIAIFPSWSPDGTQIAFMRAEGNRSGEQTLWVMDADGSNQRSLGPGRGGAMWSSDGTRLLMNSEVVAVDGSGRATLRLGPEDSWLHGEESYWSPDESQIVFVTDDRALPGGPHNAASDLWLMDADGSNVRALTSAPGRDWRPRWSPDGERIVFVSDRDGDEEVYLLDIALGTQTRLTEVNGIDGGVIWSADGEQIFFMSRRDGDFGLYAMSADGSNQHVLTIEDDAPALIYFAGVSVAH